MTSRPVPTRPAAAHMPVWRFLTGEGEVRHAFILTMAACSAAAQGLLLVLVNTAANAIAQGSPDWRFAVMFLLAWGIYVIGQQYAFSETVASVEAALQRLRLRVAGKVRDSELRVIETVGGSGTFNPLLDGAGMVSESAIALVRALKSALFLLCALLYLWLLSPPSLLVLVVILGLAMTAYVHSFRDTRRQLAAARAVEARLSGQADGMLRGFKELKLDRGASDGLMREIGTTAREAQQLRHAVNVRQVNDLTLAEDGFLVALFAVVFLVPLFFVESSDSILNITAAVLFVLGPLLLLVSGLPILASVDGALGALYALEAGLDAAAQADTVRIGPTQKKTPPGKGSVFLDKALAVTYFRMGRPHTIIGDTPFHF